MVSADLPRFRLKLREYRLLVNRNQADLAAYLNLDYNELSNRLNAHKKARLSHDNVRTIVRALAEWGAITTRTQAEELLDLMLCTHFDPADWQARPLAKLAVTPHPVSPTPMQSPITSPITLHNLPQQLSSFVGRNKELSDLKNLLTGNKGRLVSLVGPGGCGKTRLSLQVAAEVLADFSQEVWLVELAPLSDSALIAQTIATTLGLTEQSGRSILATLSDYLRSRHLLLVLDNCEHLIEECARVVETLMRTSTRLHILATSREAFGISGEITYRIPSLNLPEASPLPQIEKLSDYEAVRLFMERAKAANPDFSLTQQNAAAVVQVCRQLDGIPLALELAAARIKVLTIEQIAVRLVDRFQFLTGGSRTALPRQQTLKALVDWSYDLLTPREGKLLARLSIFSGGWTLNDAEAICSSDTDGLASYEILDALSGLVNKSLVQLEAYKDGHEAHYFFLETIRHYALEKLQVSGEEDVVRLRHLSYYAALVEELGLKLRSHEQPEGLRQLDRALDNVRTAIEYGLKVARVEALVKLTANFYWEIRGYYSEGRGYLKQVLALPEIKSVNRGLVLYFSGFLAMRQGDGQAGHASYEECLALSQEHNDKQLLVYAFTGMGNIHLELGILHADQESYAKARRYYEQAIAISEETGGLATSQTQVQFSMVLVEQCDFAQAHYVLEEALVNGKRAGNQWSITLALLGLGKLAMILEDYATAHRYLEEARQISEEISFHVGKTDVLCYQGVALANEANFAEACQSLEESLIMCLKGGLRNVTSNSLIGVTRLLSQIWQEKKEPTQPEQLATLAGAVWALVGSPGAAEPLLVQPFRSYYMQAITLARSGLNETNFEAAFASGQALSLEKAIAYARQTLASSFNVLH